MLKIKDVYVTLSIQNNRSSKKQKVETITSGSNVQEVNEVVMRDESVLENTSVILPDYVPSDHFKRPVLPEKSHDTELELLPVVPLVSDEITLHSETDSASTSVENTQ